MSSTFPVGPGLDNSAPAARPNGEGHVGQHVRLERPDAARDAATLWAATHGPDCDPGQWTYMGYGPFADANAMGEWMTACAGSLDPLFMLVRALADARPLGMVSFMNIVERNRSLELGNIWYAPAARRSAVNTETVYLMLGEAFDRLGYRRVEWKCDALNAPSRAAAARLGFSFEGIFAQHMIIKGRNRDTAWFAMTDAQWPAIRRNFAAVLGGTAERSLRTLNAPLLHPRVAPLA